MDGVDGIRLKEFRQIRKETPNPPPNAAYSLSIALYALFSSLVP